MAQEDVDVQQQNKGFGSKARDFGRWVWNPQKKEFIGRSGTSWAKIGLFYMIFYSCLAGFFAVMLVGFFSTLDSTAPTQTEMYSLIKSNPGMGFRPMVNKESTLIQFNADQPDSYQKHIEDIESLLKDYEVQGDNYTDCEGGKPDGATLCKFPLDKFGPNCTKENAYGYRDAAPCVLLKINRVYKWVPQTFDCNKTAAEETSDIAKEGKTILEKEGRECKPDYIGITCEGESDSDADNMKSVKFYPDGGFSKVYYPYMNVKGYLSPLVFVQFENVNHGVLIQVWCKLWAYNIKHHKNDKAGSVHFELVVDKPRPQ